ncbi:hypothetical protein [Streptomyces sp. HM190]|uniref:hypothetical protein n=1 Tax=Streptomyces sp. HM190 TaxID=2695266 RepID=UPI001F446674|nr:hypothetical protein [Streptomyces sp. HM190]
MSWTFVRFFVLFVSREERVPTALVTRTTPGFTTRATRAAPGFTACVIRTTAGFTARATRTTCGLAARQTFGSGTTTSPFRDHTPA